MQLKLYDTLTRSKRDFVPLDWELGVPKARRRVRMYVCGPTVYDFAHIGNARPVIVFDVLFRLLRHLYGSDRVVYVRNITDVDDRINARATELGVPIRELTERTYRDFAADVRALGCLPPTFEPRATEYIEPMQAMIERLIGQGNAYVAEEHVLFHVPSMPDYGELSKRPLDEMLAGARVEVAPYKRNPMDFVLWKPSKPGEPAWPSPAGIATPGRPGWHIECSAMAWRHLGEMFDIHGGGIDLEFPHHENEIAQSRSAFHTPLMARFWVHNGFLQLEGEKMAKSVGNVVTMRELLERWPGDVLRMQMLLTHYRHPIDWTEMRSELAGHELEDWAHVVRNHYDARVDDTPTPEVLEALSDDLNTPDAITALRSLFSKAKGGIEANIVTFAQSCKFFGFRQLDKPGLFEGGVAGINVDGTRLLNYRNDVVRLRAAIANNAPESIQSEIISQIEQDNVRVDIAHGNRVSLVGRDRAFSETVERLKEARSAARKVKNFAEADRIRDELASMGVALTDQPNGTTTWEVKR
jgi:cysteinyl-tRNA synthetase